MTPTEQDKELTMNSYSERLDDLLKALEEI